MLRTCSVARALNALLSSVSFVSNGAEVFSERRQKRGHLADFFELYWGRKWVVGFNPEQTKIKAREIFEDTYMTHRRALEVTTFCIGEVSQTIWHYDTSLIQNVEFGTGLSWHCNMPQTGVPPRYAFRCVQKCAVHRFSQYPCFHHPIFCTLLKKVCPNLGKAPNWRACDLLSKIQTLRIVASGWTSSHVSPIFAPFSVQKIV